MPGTPHSKACNACRKLRKKCDTAKPACSRCVRLKLKCVGSGEQRYLFKTSTPDTVTLRRSPESRQGSTAGALVAAIQVRDVRYDLSHFGAFFVEIPARLGRSAALDASVVALMSARQVFVHQGAPTSETLTTHGASLLALRGALSDAETASTPETLCALYINLVCQQWTGGYGVSEVDHILPMLHLMNSIDPHKWTGDFEQSLLWTLTMPVIIESLFNPRINPNMPFLAEKPFVTKLKPARPRGVKEIAAVAVPSLIALAGYLRHPERHLPQLRDAYSDILADTAKLRGHLDNLIAETSTASSSSSSASSAYPRIVAFSTLSNIYALACTAALLVNGVLAALAPTAPHETGTSLRTDASALSRALIWLASHVMGPLRPLGAGSVPMCLSAVLAVSDDASLMDEAAGWIAEYQRDVVDGHWERQAGLLRGALDLLRARAMTGDVGGVGGEVALQAPGPGMCVVM